MKKIITLLLVFLSVAACAQKKNIMNYPTETAPALGDYIYLIKGGTIDRKTTKEQFQQSLLDSLVDVRVDMALQQIDIDKNTDSIVAHKLLIDSLFAQVALLWDTVDYYHPPIVTGNYTVYFSQPFSEYALGHNDQARARLWMGSDEIFSTWDSGRDSTVIEIRGEVTDTIWKCLQPDVSGSSGVQWYGKMKLNGTNYDADTFTYVRFSYYMKHSVGFDWSNGGKRLGLYGDGIDNDGTGLFPSGWVAEGCPPDPPDPDYDPEWGPTILGTIDGPEGFGAESVGGYLGYHNKWEASCGNLTYDEVWVMDGTGTDGDPTSTTLDKDGTFADDTWYKVTIGIKLNTVTVPGTGDANGHLTWSRNDTCMGVMDGIIWRNYESIDIDYWGLKTFFGGGDDPGRTEDSYVYYDDLILWADDDRTLPLLNEVETDVPPMSTPNTE